MAKCQQRDIDGAGPCPGDPTAEEIAARCLEVQNGFTDQNGVVWPAWDAATRRSRKMLGPGDVRRFRPDEDCVEMTVVRWADVNATDA